MKNKKYLKKLELLAPAGSLDKMKTALAFGADAVYLGIPDFSLRVRINNFDMKQIQEALEYCHQQKKKIYVTANIFAHNRHLPELKKYIHDLKKMGVDAIIAADPGVISVIKKVWPNCEIHLSTQANCTNWQAAKFWYEQGVKRVVLGREVTLSEIREIKKKVPKLELEYFIHGAMCMAYSGRCFLSKHFVDRSGNLGDCVQPCRWKYDSQVSINDYELKISDEKRSNSFLEVVEEKHGSYILNSKDLMLLDYLGELIEAGVTSFKIEGRAKSAYYQAMVAGIYREALDLFLDKQQGATKKIGQMKKDLEKKIVNRGFTSGFLLGGKADEDSINTHQQIDWEFCGQKHSANSASDMSASSSKKISGKFLSEIKVHNVIKQGDEVEVVMPFYTIRKIKIKKMYELNGEEVKEAHGGQDKRILLETNFAIPEWTVLRRKLLNNPDSRNK